MVILISDATYTEKINARLTLRQVAFIESCPGADFSGKLRRIINEKMIETINKEG